MLKKKIVIASVLKPVNDARMYEKIGRSLAETGIYEVHIIGYPSTIPSDTNITFHPLKKFARLGIGRLHSYWNITKTISKVKPHILLVNTHELLVVSVIIKIIFGSKILYDIQENYFRNIWYQDNYPPGLKHLLAVAVRTAEWCSMPFIDHKLLAETKYMEELPFAGKNSTEILNKYNPLREIKIRSRNDLSKRIRFIYSGTIAKVYGIEDAISFFLSINRHIYSTLTIIGHCPSNELFKWLIDEFGSDKRIRLIISPTPIDHERIIEEYKHVDIALTPYHFNKSTANCIPVKFYEYIAHRIPILVPDDNAYWIDFLSHYQAFIAINFRKTDARAVIDNIISTVFYPKKEYVSIFWNTEKTKLLELLAKYLSI